MILYVSSPRTLLDSCDLLNTISSTATTAKFKDSPAVNCTTFQVVGVWAAAPVDSALRLTALSDLHVWLGLNNSDDQGTCPVTVTGMINDIVVGTVNVEEARVECNGVSAQVANRAFVAVDVPLQPGPNTLTCTGIDRAGNVDTEHIGVTLDTVTPARITLVSGNNQTAHIEELLPEPLVVSLTENGAPAPGKPVRFKVLRNNGSLNADASGRAFS
jgi:hypothetical protein